MHFRHHLEQRQSKFAVWCYYYYYYDYHYYYYYYYYYYYNYLPLSFGSPCDMPSIYPSLLVLLDASTRNLIVMLAICYPAQPGRDERPTDTPRCVKADRHWGALGTTQPSPAQGSVETSHPPGRSQGKMRGQANKPTNSPRNNLEASKKSLRPGVCRRRQKGPPKCPQRSPQSEQCLGKRSLQNP